MTIGQAADEPGMLLVVVDVEEDVVMIAIIVSFVNENLIILDSISWKK